MKKTRYTEEQIAFELKQAETGTCVGEVCRKMGISEADSEAPGGAFPAVSIPFQRPPGMRVADTEQNCLQLAEPA